MNIGRLRFFSSRRAKKVRDDDLALFRELFKRERETNKSLLDEASTEFSPFHDAVISVDVHKIPKAKRGDDFGNGIQKYENDWLKTPPEAPPFWPPEIDFAQPSNPRTVVQKELPLIPPPKPSRINRKVSKPLKFTSPRRETPDANSDSDSDSNPDQPSPPRFDRAPRFVNNEFSSAMESVREVMFVNSPENRQAGISLRPETPEEDPNPPSLRRCTGGKADPNPKQSNKEAPGKKKPEPITQTQKLKPDMRKPPPDMEDPIPEHKIKPVKRTDHVTTEKRKKEVKPHKRTVSPVVKSRVPERRANSATRSRERAPATGSVERRRSTSEAKGPAVEHEKGEGRRGEKGNGGSAVEKNTKPTRSTATRATASGKEQASKFRWV